MPGCSSREWAGGELHWMVMVLESGSVAEEIRL